MSSRKFSIVIGLTLLVGLLFYMIAPSFAVVSNRASLTPTICSLCFGAPDATCAFVNTAQGPVLRMTTAAFGCSFPIGLLQNTNLNVPFSFFRFDIAGDTATTLFFFQVNDQFGFPNGDVDFIDNTPVTAVLSNGFVQHVISPADYPALTGFFLAGGLDLFPDELARTVSIRNPVLNNRPVARNLKPAALSCVFAPL